MTQRIREKISEIRDYLEELKEVRPETYEEYTENLKSRLASERSFQKIVEAVTDLAFIFIAWKKMKTPDDDKNAFDVLEENDIIDEKLKTSLKEARGMRNILSHQYAKVDNEIVYESITEEIEKDSQDFLDRIESNS